MIIGILARRLREGKTYEDFRQAWLPEKGFGVRTRVVSAQGLEDPREIVTVGFTAIGPRMSRRFSPGWATRNRCVTTASTR